ncbi:hypothetical protein [Gelidibacter sp.]|uniref:hypothetical protein n=1 Tax=Gelidibacter sp. TaxID=2018083 RepID=UPI002B609819|nr:hypothetical protein [Gelidibacter sp.]HUH27905.1 hypothetical protein [Gelidibacter sp.]
MKITFPKRFLLLKGFVLLFLGISILWSVIFLIWNFTEIDHGIVALATVFMIGLFYDIGTVSFFALIGSLYFLAMPKRLICLNHL